MELEDGFVSEEHREQRRCANESVDPLALSPLETVPSSPKSLRSPRCHGGGGGMGSPLKALKHSRSRKDGRPMKGGSGGKGTWGGLLDGGEQDHHFHPKDPNYDSDEQQDNDKSSPIMSEGLDEFKRNATVIIEEYFATDDGMSAANELRDLGHPSYRYYFVKRLISTAMDRHDKEKEMAALLLSDLYSEVISPPQVQKGFAKLVECCDDLSVDIPDAVDVLALFIARAVVDDILPPAFLTKQVASLPQGSKGVEVMKRAAKSYLSAPLHAEIILKRWGGSKSMRVEDVRARINNLLEEYVVSGDKVEACRCIRDLKLPFYHHEIVKRALVMAMEKPPTGSLILELLKEAAEMGAINSSQVSKGFNRLIDSVDDLSLDIPNAKGLLRSLISNAASEGWLCASSLVPFHSNHTGTGTGGDGIGAECDVAKRFKAHAASIIQEYFLTGDILEVLANLEEERLGINIDAAAATSTSSLINAMFVKKLVTMAMDRKNREKEMASALLSSLDFPRDDIGGGFAMLMDSAEDMSLDIPAAVEVLAMFLARAAVDEVLAPSQLDEIGLRCSPVGKKGVQMARSLLRARLSGERILRCWGGGGGGSSRSGWELEDVKGKIARLLEEYACGGSLGEACRCIKELGMPFFHHEVVKKALVGVMERKEERLWGLLRECYKVGLITEGQMAKGFRRVGESLDDLVLDVPDVVRQYEGYVGRAKKEGWLDGSFTLRVVDGEGGGEGGGGN